MATSLENTTVTYEDLAEIEREFDDVEKEIIRHQIQLSAPLYKRRAALIAQIPNFWPLVLEQAPPDIDQFIQPSDSALLLSSLTSLTVTNFEPDVDPRSVAIRFEFAPNDHFADSSLEKKFWWRTQPAVRGSWSGLVSHPVPIRWKGPEKDLTGGLLDLVIAADASERAQEVNGSGSDHNKEKKSSTPEQDALLEKIKATAIGGLSFFAWFGYIGHRITAEESAEAVAAAKTRRKQSVEAKNDAEPEADNIVDVEMPLEIFPDGDDLAVAISEDLWPSAIKYFTQAQENETLSELDFESDDEEGGECAEDDEGEEEEEEEEKEIEESRPSKKRKTC